MKQGGGVTFHRDAAAAAGRIAGRWRRRRGGWPPRRTLRQGHGELHALHPLPPTHTRCSKTEGERRAGGEGGGVQAGAEQDRSSTHTSTVDSRAGGRKDSFERLARKRMHELLGRRRHDQERPDGRGHRSSQHTPGRSDTKRADRRQGGDNSNADGLSGAPWRGGGRSPTQQPASLASPLPRGTPVAYDFRPPPRPAPSQTRLPCLYASTPGPQATPMRRPPPTPLPPAFPPQPPRYQRHPHEGGGGGAARRVNGPQLPPRACAGQNARLLLHRRLRSPSQGRKKIEKKQ